ncbi:MAG: HAD-IB family hydrolase [Chthoniobacterales bacterium]|nr:HAD-IB family hydrolase [Chthoniobacterales bacterium]
MDLVLFDLDHTLLNGDTQMEWGCYLADHDLLDLQVYKAKMAYFDEKYDQGNLDIAELLEFQFKILASYSFEKLDALRHDFVKKRIRPLITEAGWKALHKHREKGDEIILITATNEFLTKPIAELLAIKHLIASQEERDAHGRYTGGTTGTPSYREGKITRLREWLAKQGHCWEDFQSIWFYSDSHNDLPLLSLVDHPMIVNPDKKLLLHAQEQGWQIVDFGVKRI